MSKDNPAHISQPDASTFKISRAVESLENTEELVNVTHVEADTVIAHEYDILGCRWLVANFDPRLRPGARIFESIPEQVEKYLFHQARVAVHRG